MPAEQLRAARATVYEGPRHDVQRLVPHSVRRILELGCSVGTLGAAIKSRQGALVYGVEIDPDYARDAEARLDAVFVGSAEAFLAGDPPAESPFDCLIAADVLEHLVDPLDVLSRAVALLDPGAHVVVSLPNVLYWPKFRRVLAGDWPQEDWGVFDRTHLRWFTPRTAREFVAAAGLRDVHLVYKEWPLRRRGRFLSWTLKRIGLGRFTPAQLLVTARTPDPAGR
jgi:2-polyprenyl-3-methyl-5-hydroxy-6-metoxy-1,4-benzoquinol methylase